VSRSCHGFFIDPHFRALPSSHPPHDSKLVIFWRSHHLCLCSYPQGEIRANLVVPVGSMSYQYSIDTASNGISSTFPFTLTLSAFDLTGPPTAIHIHGPADVGVSSSVVVSVCGTPDTPDCNLPSSNTASSVYADFAARQVYQQTFSLQLPKAVLSSAYVNIHTAKNPSGELRGQLALIRRLPSLMRVIPITEPQRNPPPSGAPPAPSSSSSGSGQASALSRGAQAAIAIGVVFACIIMGAVGFVAYKRRQNAVRAPPLATDTLFVLYYGGLLCVRFVYDDVMLPGKASSNGSCRSQSARQRRWNVDTLPLIHSPASRGLSFSFELHFKLSLCLFAPLLLFASRDVFSTSPRNSKLVAFMTVTAAVIKNNFLHVLRNQSSFPL
jgi:hypothetical protein